jgi:hypothetical protein
MADAGSGAALPASTQRDQARTRGEEDNPQRQNEGQICACARKHRQVRNVVG